MKAFCQGNGGDIFPISGHLSIGKGKYFASPSLDAIACEEDGTGEMCAYFLPDQGKVGLRFVSTKNQKFYT